MGKKSKRQVRRLKDKLPEQMESEEEIEDSSVDSDMKIAATEADRVEGDDIQRKFGLKSINDETGMLERLKEVQANFYNRLESAKLIKKQGKIPFTEHMTISGEEAVKVPTELQVHDDIKREISFYNATRANVMKGM